MYVSVCNFELAVKRRKCGDTDIFFKPFDHETTKVHSRVMHLQEET